MDRAMVLGCPVDRLDMAATVSRCEDLLKRRASASQVSVNASKLIAMRTDARLREAVLGADLINADGQSVVWASRLLSDPLPGRVAGIDLMWRLLERAEAMGYRVFLLGAHQDVVDHAADRVVSAHPRLQLAGAHHGWFPDDENATVAEVIRDAGTDLLFVAMSSPRKEYWLADHGPSTRAALAMGVGGAFDVIAGLRRRAPLPLQRAGLEWTFRLAQEPRRLAGRYAVTNTRFIAEVAAEMIRRRRAVPH